MSYEPLTPPVDVTDDPPLHRMEWQRFEKLTVDLLGSEDGIATSDDYGPTGKTDHGVDAIARRRGNAGEEVASCKRTETVTAADLKKWSGEFFKHWEAHWKGRDVKRFILATTAYNTGDTKVQDQVTNERARFAAVGIEYELWGRHQFVAKLRPHKAIAIQFLGKVWADIICGPDVEFDVRTPGRSGILTAALVSQLADLQSAISGQVGQRADAAMNDLRAGRIALVSDLLSELRDDAVWSNIRPTIQAKIARLAAALAVRAGDIDEAERMNEEAESIEPAEEPRIASQIALEREGVGAALAALGDPISIAGKHAQAALLLMNGEATRASEVVANLNADAAEDPETIRLSALCRLALADRKGALAEIRRAEALAGDWTAVLHAGTVIRYAHALSPSVRREWIFFPNPVDAAMVRRDDESQVLLTEALGFLDRMEQVVMPHSEVPLWRLAILVTLRDKSEESSRYAAELLAGDPTEPTVISWCLTRRLDVDVTPSIEALKQQYLVSPTLYGTRILGLALAMREEATACAFLGSKLPEDLKIRAEAELWISRIKGKADIDADDRLGPSIDAAQASGDWSAIEPMLTAALDASPPHPRGMLIAQAAAEWGNWALLGGVADKLLAFETAAAVKIAAFAASHAHDHPRVLSIIDDNIASFGEALPADVRRLRADTLMRMGDVQTALREADRIAADSGQPDDQLFRAELFAQIGNLRASVPFVRQALNKGMLDPNYALHWAQLLLPVEPELSKDLWRQAVAAGFDKRNVMAAMDQAFQLGLDGEASALMRAAREQAEAGTDVVRLVNIDEAREIITQSRRDADASQTLYLQGRIPAHIFAGDNVAAFLALYLGEGGSSDGRQLLRLTRHGARPADYRAEAGWKDWVIHLDVSGLFEAYRLGLLEIIEAHPNGLRVSSSLPALLMAMERGIRSTQHTRAVAFASLVDAVASNRISVFGQVPPGAAIIGFDRSIEDQRDIDRLVAGLHKCGFISDTERAEKLGGRRKIRRPIVLKGTSALHLDEDVLEDVALAGLLDTVLEHFSLSTSIDAYDAIKRENAAAVEQTRLATLAGMLRQRLADGLQTGSYRYFQRKEEPDAGANQNSEGLLERELRDLLQPVPVANGVVWMDDRMVTSYPKSDAMPIVGTFDVVCELEREGVLSASLKREKVLELRRSGAAFIPFALDEIMGPLLDAGIHDGVLVETDALRALRRNFAAIGRVEKFMKMGDDVPELASRPYEFDMQRNRMGILADALEAVWTRDDADFDDAAIRSDWLWANLRVTQPNRVNVGDEAGDISDRFEVMQISHALDKAIEIGGTLRDRHKDRRDAFLSWAWDRFLLRKLRVDPSFLPRIGEYVAEFSLALNERTGEKSTAADRKTLRKLMIMRIMRLPPPIQNAVFSTGRFDKDAPIAKIVTVADVSFDPRTFWKSAQRAWRLGSASLKTASGEAVKLERKGHELHFSGAVNARLEDDILDCFVSNPNRAAAAIERFIAPLDMAEDEARSLRASLSAATHPHGLAELLSNARKDAPGQRYHKIHETLEKRESFQSDLVEPPPFGRFGSYLGLEPGPFEPSQLIAAYRRLRSRNIGAVGAAHRIWGIPVSMPSGVFALLEAGELEEATAKAITPVAITHLATEHLRREGRSASFLALIERLVETIENRGVLFLSILRWVEKSFFRDPDWRAADKGVRLLSVWSHADRLFEEFVREEVPQDELIAYLDEHPYPLSAPDLLDGRELPSDVAAPDTLTRGVLLYHCLAEIFGDAPLDGIDQSIVDRIEAVVTMQVGELTMPDIALVVRTPTPNAMGSFLASHADGLFADGVRPQQSRDHLLETALSAIGADPDHALPTWPQLLSVAGGGMTDEQFDRFAQLFPTVDLWDLVFLEDEPTPSRWRAILIPMLRRDVETVLQALVDLSKRARHHFGPRPVDANDETPGSSGTVLFELIECAALAAGSIQGSDPLTNFCRTVELYATTWPEAAPYLRDMADNLLSLTPASRARPLWDLNLLLRSFP